MKKFLSSKNTVIIVILWGLVSILLTILYVTIQSGERNILSIAVIVVTALMIIWILVDTRYLIKNQDLFYRSGPFRGKINVLEIYKIENFIGNNPPVTTKPALDNKGFIIYYQKTKSIFISPNNEIEFLKLLLFINKDITIV